MTTGPAQHDGRDDLHLELGDVGELNGVTWEVVSRSVFHEYEFTCDRNSFKAIEHTLYFGSEWSTFPTRSYRYLLRERSNRLATLEVTLDGLVLVERLTDMPPISKMAGLGWGEGVFFRERIYRSYKRGRAELVYVDGSMPREVKTGDVSRFVDCIHQPGVLSDDPTTRVSIAWPGTGDRPDASGDVQGTLGHHVSEAEFMAAFPNAKHPMCVQEIMRPNKVPLRTARFGLATMVFSAAGMLLVFVMSTLLNEPHATLATEPSAVPTQIVSAPLAEEGTEPVRITARVQSTPFAARGFYMIGSLLFCTGGFLARRRFANRKDLWVNGATSFPKYLTDDPATLEAIAETKRQAVRAQPWWRRGHQWWDVP